MFALKLFLVPFFIGVVTLAGKRWGPSVAGWLAGFPMVVGPILFFLAIDRGAPFAANAASASLLAMSASVVLSLVYCHCCTRLGWPASITLAMLAWTLTVTALVQLPSSAYLSLAIAGGILIAAPFLFPRMSEPPNLRSLPGYEVVIRMIAGALLTIAATALSTYVSSAWSGVLAGFPVLLIVISTFSHHTNGPSFVVSLFRVTIKGLYSFLAFAFTLSVALLHLSIPLAFTLSVAAATLVQWATRKNPRTPAVENSEPKETPVTE
jgi:hypothetical protein